MAKASLIGMPLELLVHLIATYLPTKDLGALRLTSKYLETALFDTFAKEFFTKKQCAYDQSTSTCARDHCPSSYIGVRDVPTRSAC
jgi:hypothetical protein